jgi:protoporphyrinogen oxidase
MSYNKVLVLNLGFDKKSPSYTNEHWIYYPDKSLNFYRIGFYDNILNSDKLNVYVEIGYPKDAVVDDAEVERQVELTLEGMKRVGVIDDSVSLVDKSVVVMDPAYVHISEETDKELDAVKGDLASKQIHSTGRYGKWTYC